MSENADSPYAGMTVNERLFVSGLREAFEAAVRARDREEMIQILTRLDVPTPQLTADAIIERPAFYGY